MEHSQQFRPETLNVLHDNILRIMTSLIIIVLLLIYTGVVMRWIQMISMELNWYSLCTNIHRGALPEIYDIFSKYV